MTQANKTLLMLLVVGMGLYGCAKNPSGGTGAEKNAAREAKAQRWEEDFKAAAAARDDYRQKLLVAEEKQAQLQKQLERERATASSERETLKAEVKSRLAERDTVQTQYDGFRKNLKDLLAQAESTPATTPAITTVPGVPTIPVVPASSPAPSSALIGSQPASPPATGSTLSN
jgi:hypothetical protein